MRRFMSTVLMSVALLGSTVALTGCIVVPPARPVHVWVPGYWSPAHVWVGGYWRYR